MCNTNKIMTQNMIFQDSSHIFMESDAIKIKIDPVTGGKIRSFISKRTQTEFFYTDTRKRFHTASYSNHDISGYDECFPTVAPCAYPDGRRKGLPMGDHGWLWQKPWQMRIKTGQVVMSRNLPELQCYFERTCYFETSKTLRLDYIIQNYSDETFKYIYSAHPLLYAGCYTHIVFPDEMRKVFVYLAINVPGLTDKTWIDWPPPNETTLNETLSGYKKSVVKLFSQKLTDGKASVRHNNTGETLQFEFDTKTLPYLGILINQGFDSGDGSFKDTLFLGIEPTTGIGDDLPTCPTTGSVQEISPGQEVKFWIKLTLE